MEKIEYLVQEFFKKEIFAKGPDIEAMQSKLNELGAEGWEVASSSFNVAAYSVIVILKRKVAD